VLFLDLDNFKLINDTLGHDAGDSLLRQFADRIRATIRTQRRTRPLSATNAPVIARFGGDEFAVLLLHLEDISEATKIGTRLAEAGQQPYQIVISVKAAESADQIMRNADAAMYESKRKGRQQSSHFSETMQLRLARQVALEDALRATVGTDAFSIDYQPIVDLTTNRMVSVEALLRWSHPLLGDVTPTEFVPIAENSGLILPIGDWVLREACRQFAVWRADAPAQCPNSISVNVSRAHLAQGEGLYSLVKQILKDFDLPPHCLTLEVTEREVMRYPEFSLQTLESIHKLGVKLAMDDFGTGASSLGCLRSYPFDTIKIDRSFLSDLERGQEARSVLNATVALVRSLGMKAVAEGIERETQLKLLKDMGVALGQGYYLGQPRPGATLLREVAKDRASRSEEHSIFLE
jgi:diguanylate cyclase (GGDEF)-like protein